MRGVLRKNLIFLKNYNMIPNDNIISEYLEEFLDIPDQFKEKVKTIADELNKKVTNIIYFWPESQPKEECIKDNHEIYKTISTASYSAFRAEYGIFFPKKIIDTDELEKRQNIYKWVEPFIKQCANEIWELINNK